MEVRVQISEVDCLWRDRSSDSSVAMLRLRQMRFLRVRSTSLVAPSVGPPHNKDAVHVLLVQGSELWYITSICSLSRGAGAINTQHLVRAGSKQGTSRKCWALPSVDVRTSAGRTSVADTNLGTTSSTCKKE